jgi:hypothetical protein
MHNPFQLLTEAFHPQYRVNLSIERLDGSIMLTLSEEQNVVAKRLISPAQRNDERRLRNVIRSLQQRIELEHAAV